ncbi:MAG: hypothetical protein A2W90_07615 [Bacteroidetes bacterium GWF2_42_66]|nr:MAG: hypothetical protein A2W92_07605 [Bacteroidetes bacterium GWA2_42_15]OFX96953.1 MAG: hypothetical protein A2W89_20315 [Bacteroidetes bacterium GWE2_42_39]OFY44710.1 MAG: hypothetical protein A2W90_07615 [Bacteroidetes bacterium GWF2_42_66]HAZ03066.1 hypothetical protein [Marinilabiliales bacterium]HBL74998.1 hypothetical protein [Prolixibacteraceae bacterium]
MIKKFGLKISLLSVGLLSIFNFIVGQDNALPPWQEGYLDIHHISTGRGNASFILFPDETSLVIDCGDMSETHPLILSERNAPAVPDHSKTPAQWVADYIWQFHPEKKNATIDFALITHYHDDHFGEIDSLKERCPEGDYLLTGITELGSIIPIKTLIDRGCDFPINFKDEEVQKRAQLIKDPYSMLGTLQEYWKFIDYQSEANGLSYEKFKVGSTQQIKLAHNTGQFPSFIVKNLFVNGEICSDTGSKTYCLVKQGEYHGENELSAGIRISYGGFNYYTGGDIGGIDQHGQNDPNSMETKAAPVIGPVDVATMNHHGNRSSMNTYFISCLRPRVWIGQSWSSDHPGMDVLRRVTSTYLYPGERDLFATAMLKANKLVIGDLIDKSYQSESGHILVRVYPGGGNYSVFILNDETTDREVKAKFDYSSKSIH